MVVKERSSEIKMVKAVIVVKLANSVKVHKIVKVDKPLKSFVRFCG
jgi:hypothetical protein